MKLDLQAEVKNISYDKKLFLVPAETITQLKAGDVKKYTMICQENAGPGSQLQINGIS